MTVAVVNPYAEPRSLVLGITTTTLDNFDERIEVQPMSVTLYSFPAW
jgi:hypothetical protein